VVIMVNEVVDDEKLVIQARELIGKAADWLETNDWWQGYYWEGGTNIKPKKCCIYGALNLVSYGSADCRFNEVSTAEGILIKNLGSLANWNDDAGQTKENVIKTLREIANDS